ncbi:hypothetical protein RFI_17119 [Reticulomyxa filosa]|uniref:Glycoside hydrolase family 5 domain-containing protein n=1 Tax=Reticulomyxa filosa TaxID=46433 RepID=X6N2Y0_RETFI|nr:hypothetical protein RFI_17119 [Reticulomyxa filosa]|eukprot:ETO20099.1 hypothetical protein RFI_17119 [Reticulomyxa filosa]
MDETTIGWASSYETYAIGAAAQRMYDNRDNIRDKFASNFWQRVAKRFKNNPGILGYELINEPWIGDKWTIPALRIPSSADIINLQRFYEYLNDAIREIDNDTIIFYEPATGGNYYDATPVGFTHGPGGEAYNSKQSLSFHIYCPFIQSDVPIGPILKNETLAVCEGGNKDMLRVRVRDIAKLNTSGFLTEFGAIPMTEQGFELITYMMNLCDEYRIGGWTYWLLNPSGNFDDPNPEVPYLTRTFARKIAGQLHAMDFDFDSKNFLWCMPLLIKLI